jgi:BirA family biotin operon repressor/biotin-[acetyl-CoA-carboxylase] ligase
MGWSARNASPYTDIDRPPLSEARLRRALLTAGALWTALDYRACTGSTNADAASQARTGAAEGYVVVADQQTAGRGRQDRAWLSPPRAGLAISVLLRPGEAVAGRDWSPIPLGGYAVLPLLAGVALVEAVRRAGAVDAVLKWPNDLLIGDRKCAGVLAETVPSAGPPAVVVGIGLNVTLREPELPQPDATSLQLAGSACVDRDPLLRAVLRGLADWYVRWRDAGGDAEQSGLIEAYRFHCATIGAKVSIALPGDAELVGVATAVDDDGSLRVGDRSVAAGDVIHLRAN